MWGLNTGKHGTLRRLFKAVAFWLPCCNLRLPLSRFPWLSRVATKDDSVTQRLVVNKPLGPRASEALTRGCFPLRRWQVAGAE